MNLDTHTSVKRLAIRLLALLHSQSSTELDCFVLWRIDFDQLRLPDMSRAQCLGFAVLDNSSLKALRQARYLGALISTSVKYLHVVLSYKASKIDLFLP